MRIALHVTLTIVTGGAWLLFLAVKHGVDVVS